MIRHLAPVRSVYFTNVELIQGKLGAFPRQLVRLQDYEKKADPGNNQVILMLQKFTAQMHTSKSPLEHSLRKHLYFLCTSPLMRNSVDHQCNMRGQ